MPGVPLTNVVRMGIVPAAAPKSPFTTGPRPTLGLSAGLRAWVFPTGDSPLGPPRTKTGDRSRRRLEKKTLYYGIGCGIARAGPSYGKPPLANLQNIC